MDFSAFLRETPLWLLLVFGVSYAVILGCGLWLLARLCRTSRR